MKEEHQPVQNLLGKDCQPVESDESDEEFLETESCVHHQPFPDSDEDESEDDGSREGKKIYNGR